MLIKNVDASIPILLCLNPVRYRCKSLLLKITTFIEARLPALCFKQTSISSFTES